MQLASAELAAQTFKGNPMNLQGAQQIEKDKSEKYWIEDVPSGVLK